LMRNGRFYAAFAKANKSDAAQIEQRLKLSNSFTSVVLSLACNHRLRRRTCALMKVATVR